MDLQVRQTVTAHWIEPPKKYPQLAAGIFLEQRVDERGERRSLGKYNQCTEKNHHEDDRRKPEFLALPHKVPEI